MSKDDILPLTSRNAATPPSRDRIGLRVEQHYGEAAAAIRSVPRASTTRPLTMPTAPTKRR